MRYIFYKYLCEVIFHTVVFPRIANNRTHTWKATLPPHRMVSIEIPATFHPHIDGALVRLRYLHPDLRFTKSETGLAISVPNECNTEDLITNTYHEIYREKIYVENATYAQFSVCEGAWSMKVWPLKFRQLAKDFLLFVDDAGGFFRASNNFLDRYVSDKLTAADEAFLLANGHAYHDESNLPFISFAYRWVARQNLRQQINYVMLVPTLRCDLSCTYCQVSSATQTSFHYDWSEATLEHTLNFLDRFATDTLKIEFQGGEPLLRLDFLERVRAFCRNRFSHAEFVVCTNLQHLDEAALAFLAPEDTFISTSLDGDLATHTRQRTKIPN